MPIKCNLLFAPQPIGERIVREELKHKERAEYGKYLVENLSADLEVEKSELARIVKFYRQYPIMATLSQQLDIYDKTLLFLLVQFFQ